MFENFNEDKRKNPMTQFSDFHTGWSIYSIQYEMRSIREHLKKIGDNSEQTRILIHVFFLLSSLKF